VVVRFIETEPARRTTNPFYPVRGCRGVILKLPMPDSASTDPTFATPAAPRTRRWPRILLWSAGGVLALLLLVAGAGVLWLRSATIAALPALDGDLHLAGLSAPVTVRRDAHGVPHIDAATEDDLFMAQGYVTAQDRLWQMDLYRRNANGELAEIFGSSQLKHDRTQRVLQIRNTARRIYANLPSADRARLDDYARGVNLFIAQHQATLPPEFRLLGYRPQPWSGADSISIGLMLVQGLDTHWETKLERERIAAKLGRFRNPKLEADLYPVGSWRDHPPTGVQVDLSQPRPARLRLPTTRTTMTAARPAPRRKSCAKRWVCPPATAACPARTTGSSPGGTRPAASLCSRTICTSRFSNRTSGSWPICVRRATMLPG